MKKFTKLLLFAAAFASTGLAQAQERELGGLKFDGQDDVVMVPNHNVLNPKAITAGAWIKINHFGSVKTGNNEIRQFILFKKNKLEHFNEGLSIYIDEKNKSIYSTVASTDGKQVTVGTKYNSIEKDKWIHVAISADDKNIALYLNGDLVSKKETGFALNFDDEPLFIGNRESDRYGSEIYGGYFNGQIDEVKVYDKALADNEIKASMNESQNQAESCKLYLSFAEGKGNISNDNTENGNQGVLVNCPKWMEGSAEEASLDKDISLAPSPVNQDAIFTAKIPKDDTYKLLVSNSEGSVVKMINIGNRTAGTHSIPVNFSELESGLYILTLQSQNVNESIKFIKVK